MLALQLAAVYVGPEWLLPALVDGFGLHAFFAAIEPPAEAVGAPSSGVQRPPCAR